MRQLIMLNRLVVIKLLIVLFFCCSMTVPIAAAPSETGQKQEVDSFVYVVQFGDILIDIAIRFNLTLAQIVAANNMANPNLIFPGQQLILPGISPLITPVAQPLAPSNGMIYTVQPGDTLFKIANHYHVSIGAIVLANNLPNPDIIHLGQTLQIPGGPPPTPEALPRPFEALELSEPVIAQGRTLVIKARLSNPEVRSVSGNFEGQSLFFRQGQDYFWSIVAIHALIEPNIYPITLTAAMADGTTVNTIQNVTVVEGPFGVEEIQLDESRGELLDAELIKAEQEKLTDLWSQISFPPRWEGPFGYPVKQDSLRITSQFGTRRSYNGSSASSFHGGTDFGGGIGVRIYAPAPGLVKLAEPLTVRGNAVLIDHGLGLYSGYWHMSQLAVAQGQEVQPGDLIGYMGDTGLVTGPHLHWEMRLNGIAVEPLQWVQNTIP